MVIRATGAPQNRSTTDWPARRWPITGSCGAGELVLDLPLATEAVVSHPPQP